MPCLVSLQSALPCRNVLSLREQVTAAGTRGKGIEGVEPHGLRCRAPLLQPGHFDPGAFMCDESVDALGIQGKHAGPRLRWNGNSH